MKKNIFLVVVFLFCGIISQSYSQVQKVAANQVVAKTNTFTKIIGSDLQLLLQSIDDQIGSGGGSGGIKVTWAEGNSNNVYVVNSTNLHIIFNTNYEFRNNSTVL